MNITIVGLPGAKTQRTIINVQEAASEFNSKFSVDWISDSKAMCSMGVVHTPSILVDGKLKSFGRIPSVYEITKWIENERVEEIVSSANTPVSR